MKQGSNPADFWQIGRILLKNDRISTSFLVLNASKFNKKATLPIIYALHCFATPSHKRKAKTCCKSGALCHSMYKNQYLNLIKQLPVIYKKNSRDIKQAIKWQKSG
ncbi:hypothetical protein MNZ22_05455 [Aeromonas encheleia]|uniref:hypothetical protein n=1 Tax=Aeromonas encheleia TaxID=73010 RepID=UPI001F56EE7A|nr:hypothetical protein [Aeromonas encheleia]UNP89787.1 hypothetical protein MNZ22_05455 [Aeromonas encheleia]